MRKILLTACILFITLSITYAQNDFKPGFIIGLSNDTIQGKIDSRKTKNRFTECIFLEDGKSESITYTIDQINGYSITGRATYLKKEIPIDNAKQLFFAEVLVLGKATLVNAMEHFYLIKDGETNELIQTKESVVQNGKEYTKQNYEFISLLNIKFADCPKTSSAIRNAQLSENSLIKVVSLYNSCFGESFKTYQSNKVPSKVLIGLSFGHSSTTFGNYDHSSFVSTVDPNEFWKDETWYPGIVFEFYPASVRQRFGLHVDILFRKNSLQSDYVISNTTYIFTSREFSSINPTICLMYNFYQSKKLNVFLEGGLSPIFRINSTLKVSREYRTMSTIILDNQAERADVVGNSLCLLGGLGVSYSPTPKFSVQLRGRYETGTFDTGEQVTMTSISQSLSLLYKF